MCRGDSKKKKDEGIPSYLQRDAGGTPKAIKMMPPDVMMKDY